MGIWEAITCIIGIHRVWTGPILSEAFRSWYEAAHAKKNSALPYNIVWNTWIACNLSIFEDKLIPPEVYAYKSLRIAMTMDQSTTVRMPQIIIEEEVDKNTPWSYFDGAAQGDPARDPARGGAVGIIHINDLRWIKFAASTGSSSNNKVELMAVKFLLQLAIA